jgi:hypothetical protein
MFCWRERPAFFNRCTIITLKVGPYKNAVTVQRSFERKKPVRTTDKLLAKAKLKFWVKTLPQKKVALLRYRLTKTGKRNPL